MSLRPTLVVFAVLIASLSLGTLGLVLYLGSDAFVDSMPAPVVGPHVSAETPASAFDRNDFVGAMRATDKLLAINPANISALLAKANILAQEGSIEFKEKEFGTQAIAVAQQVLALDSHNAEAWRIIGYAHEIMQEYPLAHDAYAKSLAIDPHNALTMSQDAHSYDLEGNTTKAEAGYRAALVLMPALDQAQMGLGRIAFQKGQLQDSFRYFSAVANQSHNVRLRAEAAYSGGTVALQLGDVQTAERLVRDATRIDPQYALGWVGLGVVTFTQAIATSSDMTLAQRDQLIRSSMRSLQQATIINPRQSVAYYQLGVEAATIHQYGTADKFLSEALSLVPGDITLDAAEKAALTARTRSARTVLSAHTAP